jgi:hypothetical protein
MPGAVGLVRTTGGDELLVAHHRIDAVLTPCQLRAGLLEPVALGAPHLSSVVDRVECTGGAVDLGAGLFQRSHPSVADERWFSTSLSAEAVLALVATCPKEIEHPEVSVRISADVELGACAVCVSASAGIGLRLDEVAAWLHGQCLVAELIEHVTASR